MILVTHHKDRVVHIKNQSAIITGSNGDGLLLTILQLAKEHPDALLVWVEKDYHDVLNLAFFRKNDIPNNHLLSFNPGLNYMSKDIGYVEETLFINVNKEVKYPTWLMSAIVGCASSLVFNSIRSTLSTATSFNYYLNALAKAAMPKGLLCYSNPSLLKKNPRIELANKRLNTRHFFGFIKQHYKKRWLFLVPLQQLIFEGRFTLLYAMLALIKRSHHLTYNAIQPSSIILNSKQTIDVIIPTIGRKDYLFDVLKDLSLQSQIPNRIFIVEQNPDNESSSQLDYLQNEKWPFEIKHTFIHQTGACNARNIAIEQVESDWVFFADDDVRLKGNALAAALFLANEYDFDAITLSCLQKNEKEQLKQPIQWAGFGSGTSLVKASAMKNKKFDMVYEHGHGEDGDFGMQLRNTGTDVLYAPHIQLLHLKAPIGGFRKKDTKEWDHGLIAPKPSPTVMCYKLKYLTPTQLKSYKFLLFIKYYPNQSIKNLFAYFSNMKKAWNCSIEWAQKLQHRHG